MSHENRWLLPQGVDELLPPQAWQLEQLRRNLLDLYDSWGYELVMPPFVEFLDSLLIGTGSDLDLQTFKLIDQLSGRTLGVRADMTPQVARIDAHRLQHKGPTRLCYMGTVLHTRSDEFGSSRAPVQIGAELYGHSGSASDLEIIHLMLTTLQTSQIKEIYLDLGHVAIFRSLVQMLELDQRQEADLFDILQRKALPDLQVAGLHIYDEVVALLSLHGGAEILPQARTQLSCLPKPAQQALDELEHITTALHAQFPKLPLHIDLAELRGYHYHTGLVFTAYIPGLGQELARGGRYDKIGAAFGRARPATGFSADLKALLLHGQNAQPCRTEAIYVPDSTELSPSQQQSLQALITQLRNQGQRVICALPQSHIHPVQLGCNRELRYIDQSWEIQPLNT